MFTPKINERNIKHEAAEGNPYKYKLNIVGVSPTCKQRVAGDGVDGIKTVPHQPVRRGACLVLLVLPDGLMQNLLASGVTFSSSTPLFFPHQIK